jgi:hypothetical protein
MKESIDYNIISEAEFHSKQEAKNFKTLICVKLYNEDQCTNYMRSLYIECLLNNHSVDDIVKTVIDLYCPNSKSKAVSVFEKNN